MQLKKDLNPLATQSNSISVDDLPPPSAFKSSASGELNIDDLPPPTEFKTPARSTPLSMREKSNEYLPKWGQIPNADELKRQAGLTARAGLEGFVSPILYPLDVVTGAVNGVLPKNHQILSAQAQFSQGMTEIGLPQPNNSNERLAADLGGAVFGTGSMVKLANIAETLSKTPVQREIYRSLGIKPTLQAVSAAAGAGASGEVRESGGSSGEQMAAGVIGSLLPSAGMGANALRKVDYSSRNAIKKIKQAMEGTTEEEYLAAEKRQQQGHEVGVPLVGPESFKGGSQIQQLASETAASPSGSKLRNFTKDRTELAEKAIKGELSGIGSDVGRRESANQAETAATKVITNAEHAQTQGVKPFYDAAAKNKIPETAAQSIIKKIDDAIAEDKTNVLAPKLRELRNALTESKAVPEKRTAMVHDEHGNLVSMELPEMPKAPKTDSLIKDIAKAGGIKSSELSELGLTENLAKEYAPGLIKPKGGRGMDGVMEWMQQNGWLSQHEIDAADKLKPGGGQQLARDLIMKELAGDEVYHPTVVDAVGSYKRELSDWEQQYGKYSKTAKVTPAKPEKLVTDIENLDRARKYFRDKIELPTIAPDAIPKEVAAKMGPILADIRKEMMAASKSFAKGKALYETIQKTRIDPLMKGPVGNVAGKGADAQREATYSRVMNEISSPTATPERIGKLADELKAVDKTAFPNVVRAYLESEFSTAFKDLQTGPNVKSGVNFRNAIEGTPQEKKNIRAMIQKVAEAQGQDPAKVYQGFGKLLDVLDSTGRVPGMGSQTYSRMEGAKEARTNPVSSALETVSTKPFHFISKTLEDWFFKKTYNKLADVFTAPDSVQQMKKLANVDPKSPYARHLVEVMLLSTARSTGKNYDTKNDSKRGGDNDGDK